VIAKLPAGTFYGETESRCARAGFTFVESTYAAGSQLSIPIHTHQNAFLCLIVAGVCEESSGGRTRTAGPPSLVFHPAGEPHADRWHNVGGRAFHMEISQSRARAIGEFAPILSRPAAFENGMPCWLATRLYREYQRHDNFALLAMEGLTLEILAEVSRLDLPKPEPKPPRWLLHARDLLHARFVENLSLEEIGSEIGVHPVHLARVFRRQFKCTPGDYVRRLRIDTACRHLATSGLPLAEIALSTGFADQSHFTKTFSRLMQMTPGEFRRNFRAR
jgi:AraC family transcriptional regulator